MEIDVQLAQRLFAKGALRNSLNPEQWSHRRRATTA